MKKNKLSHLPNWFEKKLKKLQTILIAYYDRIRDKNVSETLPYEHTIQLYDGNQ